MKPTQQVVSRLVSRLVSLVAVAAFVPVTAATLSAQGRGAVARSAPIADVRYQVTFNPKLGAERSVAVSMTFTASGRDPVLLSLPVWTPGDYEVSNYARNVSKFSASSRGKPLRWDKSDPETWRIVTENGGPITVDFEFRADSLDNAATWARNDFLLFNGTNLFLYPQGRSPDFPATVTLVTEPAWRVTTGMTEAGARTWSATSYNDLVDHPFFVGNFDVDSAQVAGVWMRFSSYPPSSVKPAERKRLLDQMARAIPTEVAVFADRPWGRYDIMQIADSGFGGMSALEHENSNVGVIGAQYVDEDFVPSVYAHEIFHSWNVKRLRPSDMWPYHYDAMQPTPWLWVSEGITDYYADLALVRGGVINAGGFLADVEKKMAHVDSVGPVALTDASLQTWLHMTDGTQDIYYDKGSLAGLALDILIRDATDNAETLDHVMRSLYAADFRNGRGFTSDDWWNAVSRAAKGLNVREFNAAYVDGRDPYPWPSWLAKAGWRVHADTLHEPRLGVSMQADSAGLLVVIVAEGSMADRAGIKPGDLITSIAGVSVNNPAWESWRQKYANQEGAPVPVGISRDGKPMTVSAKVQLVARVVRTLENDPAATDKAKRIREGILKGS